MCGKRVSRPRQFRDFDEYLVPAEKFATLKRAGALPLAVATDCEQYLGAQLQQLQSQLDVVNRLAAAAELPDAVINDSGLKITPLDTVVPDAAQALIDQAAAMMPHVKLTELLLEVDQWTGFTRHFTHLKSGEPAQDGTLLLTTTRSATGPSSSSATEPAG
jgi:hypothetical protein